MLLDCLEALARAASLHVISSRNAASFYQRAGCRVDDPHPETAVELTWMTKPL